MEQDVEKIYEDAIYISRELLGPDANIQSHLNPGRIKMLGFYPENDWQPSKREKE